MKQAAFLIAFLLFLISLHSFAQQAGTNHKLKLPVVSIEQKQLNFFIISKRGKGKLDLATRFNVFRAKLKGFFRPKKFVSVVAKNTEYMSARVEHHLLKHNATIGTIWFDSHGQYKKGYSLFFIGKDEYSYKTINDTAISQPLVHLATYSDNRTKFIIGSCYGGATYRRPSIDYKDTTRMNGDSLMIAIGKVFQQAHIYGSESWVMTKPGLFLKKAAVGGFPGRKLFRDVCYEAAWQNVGKWNQYNAITNSFQQINTIALDMYGNIVVRGKTYIEEKNKDKEIIKKLEFLQTGLYK